MYRRVASAGEITKLRYTYLPSAGKVARLGHGNHQVRLSQLPIIAPFWHRWEVPRIAFDAAFRHPLLEQSDLCLGKQPRRRKVSIARRGRPRRHIVPRRDLGDLCEVFLHVLVVEQGEGSGLARPVAAGTVLENDWSDGLCERYWAGLFWYRFPRGHSRSPVRKGHKKRQGTSHPQPVSPCHLPCRPLGEISPNPNFAHSDREPAVASPSPPCKGGEGRSVGLPRSTWWVFRDLGPRFTGRADAGVFRAPYVTDELCRGSPAPEGVVPGTGVRGSRLARNRQGTSD